MDGPTQVSPASSAIRFAPPRRFIGRDSWATSHASTAYSRGQGANRQRPDKSEGAIRGIVCAAFALLLTTAIVPKRRRRFRTSRYLGRAGRLSSRTDVERSVDRLLAPPAGRSQSRRARGRDAALRALDGGSGDQRISHWKSAIGGRIVLRHRARNRGGARVCSRPPCGSGDARRAQRARGASTTR